MIICPECEFAGSHHADCKLDPSKPKIISRRSFLRSMGVLGAAILVAPSLIEPAPRAEFTEADISAILKKVYRDIRVSNMINVSPITTPLSAKPWGGTGVYWDVKLATINS